MVDVPGNASTTVNVTVGSTTNGALELIGDHDWYRITLAAGQSVSVTINGLTLIDPYLYIRDQSGSVLFENDDISSGINRNSQLAFKAGYSGTYYIDVAAFDESYSGTYQLSVQPYTPPPLATNDQIANQLLYGYWGGDSHHFNVTQGGTITVNITALTPSGQTLARAALAQWSDIIGVKFQEVTTGGQITFDDNEDGAFTDASWSGGITSTAHVNVSTQWLTDYGTSLNSYSFQAYIHEIGHALGLGHAGNYNNTARYPYDALFENDAWSTSVMSYFSPQDNTYFAGQGFNDDYLVTPMAADILAMQSLYGLSTTTRASNTTYGFNSTAGREVFNASLYPAVAYTIYDSGGTDTLDYSGYSVNQKINLNPETFSNVGSSVGNVSIARGVVIENAIGGNGDDELIGNNANNNLQGRAGKDIIEGGGGNDTIDGGGAVDWASYIHAAAGVTVNLATGGAASTVGDLAKVGVDQLTSIEGVKGTDFADVMTGNDSTNLFDGRGGSDWISGAGGDDWLVGGYGDDQLLGGAGSDEIDGDGGNDSLDGGDGDDELYGYDGNDVLIGGTGRDILFGGAGDDRISYDPADNPQLVNGESGKDTLVVIDLPAPMSFNLAGQNFEFAEVIQHDSGTNDWSTIVFTYDAAWRLAAQDMHYDNGTRILTQFDADGSQSWNRSYLTFDTQGRAASQDLQYDNGTRILTTFDANGSQNWDRSFVTYDAQGRPVSQDLSFDNGTRILTTFDADNSQNWTQSFLTYDAQGRVTSQDLSYDNGTRILTQFDADGSQNWSQSFVTYDAQGRPVSQDLSFDNGTRVLTQFDADNSQNWNQTFLNYDAQHRLVSQDISFDDGSRTLSNLDADGSRPWTQNWYYYDTQGHLYALTTDWDDGHTSTVYF